MSTKENGCGVVGLALAGMVLVTAVTAVLNGFVLTVLWGWFIIPLFAAPALTVVQAIGLGLVVGFITTTSKDFEIDDRDRARAYINLISYSFTKPVMTLIVGWVVQLFL